MHSSVNRMRLDALCAPFSNAGKTSWAALFGPGSLHVPMAPNVQRAEQNVRLSVSHNACLTSGDAAIRATRSAKSMRLDAKPGRRIYSVNRALSVKEAVSALNPARMATRRHVSVVSVVVRNACVWAANGQLGRPVEARANQMTSGRAVNVVPSNANAYPTEIGDLGMNAEVLQQTVSCATPMASVNVNRTAPASTSRNEFEI